MLNRKKRITRIFNKNISYQMAISCVRAINGTGMVHVFVVAPDPLLFTLHIEFPQTEIGGQKIGLRDGLRDIH
ncbi:MAG: hypothetical protein B6I30_01065 [Desulfobacteraceae bacterium 4572_187]|nr:MAG: hypothetical protein B6I30_01065 [Desulfobacteraceae bacterium 4572_187]